jgi:kynureninase
LGVEVEIVVSPDGVEVPLEAIAKAVDERTALLVTSHVFFSSGAIQDATALTHIAHATGASILLDAYQSNGQMEIDVETLGVDFLASGALKWLCGGPGLAYLYATRAGAALGPRSGTLSRSGSDRSASRRAGRDH